MANWQATTKRDPPKTKAELREMLAEAVRNTAQPGSDPQPGRNPQPGRDGEPKRKRLSKAETVTAVRSSRAGGR
jgi:hypothetical protein